MLLAFELGFDGSRSVAAVLNGRAPRKRGAFFVSEARSTDGLLRAGYTLAILSIRPEVGIFAVTT